VLRVLELSPCVLFGKHQLLGRPAFIHAAETCPEPLRATAKVFLTVAYLDLVALGQEVLFQPLSRCF
jgi:hypothetical protein